MYWCFCGIACISFLFGCLGAIFTSWTAFGFMAVSLSAMRKMREANVRYED